MSENNLFLVYTERTHPPTRAATLKRRNSCEQWGKFDADIPELCAASVSRDMSVNIPCHWPRLRNEKQAVWVDRHSMEFSLFCNR